MINNTFLTILLNFTGFFNTTLSIFATEDNSFCKVAHTFCTCPFNWVAIDKQLLVTNSCQSLLMNKTISTIIQTLNYALLLNLLLSELGILFLKQCQLTHLNLLFFKCLELVPKGIKITRHAGVHLKVKEVLSLHLISALGTVNFNIFTGVSQMGVEKIKRIKFKRAMETGTGERAFLLDVSIKVIQVVFFIIFIFKFRGLIRIIFCFIFIRIFFFFFL